MWVLKCWSQYTARIAGPPNATRFETRKKMTGLFNLECGGRMFITINETLHYDIGRLNLYAESWNVWKFAKKTGVPVNWETEKNEKKRKETERKKTKRKQGEKQRKETKKKRNAKKRKQNSEKRNETKEKEKKRKKRKEKKRNEKYGSP